MISDINYMSFLRVCRAVLIFCLGSPVEFYCKTCFEVLSIPSLGTKVKMFRENNAYFDSMLKRWDRIFDWNCKHSVSLLDHGLYYTLPTNFLCCSFTSRKLYGFLETLLCFCINLNIRNFIPEAKYC